VFPADCSIRAWPAYSVGLRLFSKVQHSIFIFHIFYRIIPVRNTNYVSSIGSVNTMIGSVLATHSVVVFKNCKFRKETIIYV